MIREDTTIKYAAFNFLFFLKDYNVYKYLYLFLVKKMKSTTFIVAYYRYKF